MQQNKCIPAIEILQRRIKFWEFSEEGWYLWKKGIRSYTECVPEEIQGKCLLGDDDRDGGDDGRTGSVDDMDELP